VTAVGAALPARPTRPDDLADLADLADPDDLAQERAPDRVGDPDLLLAGDLRVERQR
jgi:hypothetical protein